MVGTWRAASVKAKGKCRDVTLWRPQQSSDVACRVPSNFCTVVTHRLYLRIEEKFYRHDFAASDTHQLQELSVARR